MTGYATQSFLFSRLDRSTEVVIIIKSLNSRFFEIAFKLAPAFFPYEIEISKLLKERLFRGSIQCLVTINTMDFFQETVVPSMNTATAYFNALHNIRETLNIQDPVTLDHLVRMPDLFTTTETPLQKEEREVFFEKLNQAIEVLIEQRRIEGDNLQHDIESRLLLIDNEIQQIKKKFVIRIAEQKKRVQETLKEIEADESILASAQRTALYTILDKLDLQEEITRFESHQKNMTATIASKSIEKGKRLDFTLQEMLREDNTILAKCNDSSVSEHAITIKVELEKIREQIQNII